MLARTSTAPHVRCFGLRRDVQPILADADLLLLTSREESFSMAALEAAACAVPTVAADVGGLSEVVGDGGVLYDRRDDRSAIDAVVSLLCDPERRRAAADAALARAATFSANAVVPRYEALYRGLPALRVATRPHGSPVEPSPALRGVRRPRDLQPTAPG